MPITPQAAGTIAWNCTETSSAKTVPATFQLVRVYNKGTNIVYVEIGTTAVLPANGAATGGMPIVAGDSVLIDKGNATSLAAICAAGETGTLLVTPCNGDASV